MQQMIKKKPAIYALRDAPDSFWGFVSLKELAEIVELDPKKVLENFFGLSKDVDSMIVFAYGKMVRITQGSVTSQGSITSDDAEEIFVPAGWAQNVLKAHERGFTRVELVTHIHSLGNYIDCPEDTLACTTFGDRHLAAVGIRD